MCKLQSIIVNDEGPQGEKKRKSKTVKENEWTAIRVCQEMLLGELLLRMQNNAKQCGIILGHLRTVLKSDLNTVQR